MNILSITILIMDSQNSKYVSNKKCMANSITIIIISPIVIGALFPGM